MRDRPRIAFVVNGDERSAMAERAKAFAGRLSDRFATSIVFRKGSRARSIAAMVKDIAAAAPDACYVLDVGVAGIAAAGTYKHFNGTPFIVDTGDAIVELGKALGRGQLTTFATKTLEVYALRAASAVVVRGSFHRELLATRGIESVHIPDGVALADFQQNPRVRRAPSEPLVIALIGSSVWVPARQTCYGWELVELIRILKGSLAREVRGVLIGDGDGIPILRERVAKYALQGEVEFAGRLPYTALPECLSKFDICLSTQTNDVIGNVRTTGKLPLYLAAGRFVLASKVGEAARVLPPEMLVEYDGEADPAYPSKLAARVQLLVAQQLDFNYWPAAAEVARSHFDYDALAMRVAAVLQRVCDNRDIRHLARHQSSDHDVADRSNTTNTP